MSSAFVPFLQSGGKSGAPAARLAASPTADSAAVSGAFTAIVPHPAPNPPNGTPAVPCAHSTGTTQPVVTLKKDGDRVTHIHIQCACGQVVELECAY